MQFTPSKPLKLGWIPYLNMWPFRAELNKLDIPNLSIFEGAPSEVNTWLDRGDVELAPTSSICLISKASLEMALPLGVACKGPVLSVYLGFHKEHQPLLEALQKRRQELAGLCKQARAANGSNARAAVRMLCTEARRLNPIPLSLVPDLNLTPNSAASATLARAFYTLWFGQEACKLIVGRDVAHSVYRQPPVTLLIGDEALQKRRQFHSILDLGMLWTEMTGLPFVFAVWQSRGSFLNGWRRFFWEIGHRAETRMHADPTAYLGDKIPLDDSGKEIPLADYWRRIYYQLGPSEMKGLLLFLCLARHLKLVPVADEVLGKIIRWQDLSNGTTAMPVI